MNHPSEPYGQGFSGQQPGYQSSDPPVQYPAYGQPPGFPQQPSYPQPVGYPYPQAGYPGDPRAGYPGGQQPHGIPGFPPAPTPSANGATGIIAGVLAALGSLVNFFGGLVQARGLASMADRFGPALTDSGAFAALVAVVMLNVVAGAVLSVGTVTLFMRKMIGRWLVVVGCALIIVSISISLGIPATFGEYRYHGKGLDLLILVFPSVTLLLVLLPTTGRWIRAKPQSAPPPYYPPYPG